MTIKASWNHRSTVALTAFGDLGAAVTQWIETVIIDAHVRVVRAAVRDRSPWLTDVAKRRLDGGWHVPENAFETDRLDRERGRVRMLNGALEGGMEDWTMDRVQYDLVRDLIHEAFDDYADADGTLLLKDLVAISQERLGEHPAFPGGRMKNITTYVKVDLEARREIERVDGASPQRLRRLTHNR